MCDHQLATVGQRQVELRRGDFRAISSMPSQPHSAADGLPPVAVQSCGPESSLPGRKRGDSPANPSGKGTMAMAVRSVAMAACARGSGRTPQNSPGDGRYQAAECGGQVDGNWFRFHGVVSGWEVSGNSRRKKPGERGAWPVRWERKSLPDEWKS